MSIVQDLVFLHIPSEKKLPSPQFSFESGGSGQFKTFLALLMLLTALGVSIYYSIPEPEARKSFQADMLKRTAEPDLCLLERQHFFEKVEKGLVPTPFRPCLYY